MKNLFYFPMLACVMALAACSSDTEPFEMEDTTPLTLDMRIIGVGLPGSDGTRVHMNELTDMVWTDGDVLDVYGYVDKVCTDPEYFELAGGQGTQTGVFAGQFGKDWQSFLVSYKGSNVVYTPNVPSSPQSYNYLKQSQDGMNNFNHIKDHLLLRSEKMPNAETTQIIKLKPQCAILKLNVTSLPDDIKDSESMTVSFLLLNPPHGRVRNAKLQLTGKFAHNTGNLVYLAFEPGHDLDAGGDLIIEFDDGVTKWEASVTSKNGKNYEPGRIYTVTMDYKNADPWKWTRL